MIPLIIATTALATPAQINTDPFKVNIVVEDIPRFWKVFDEAKDEELETRLQKEYIDVGSPGLKFFAFVKGGGAKGLADRIRRNRAQYEKARAQSLEMASSLKAIRAAFCAFSYLYPNAKFPAVTFCIGRFTAGGTAGPTGLMIGAEMPVSNPQTVHQIVAHELIHFNQAWKSRTLQDATLAEGSADFLGELISGGLINTEQQRYGRLHESELWKQWKAEVAGKNQIGDWIGTFGQKVPRPGDLGYFVGYRITEAYFNRAVDKRAAIRDILERKDSAKFIEESGYSPS